MTLRQRHNVMTNINQENAVPGKQAAVVAVVPKRPILREIGNKVADLAPVVNTKKPVVKPPVTLRNKDAPKVVPLKERVQPRPSLLRPLNNITKPAVTVKQGVKAAKKPDIKKPEAKEPEVKEPEQELIGVVDTDKDDGNNPLFVSIYVNDIYKYLHTLELQFPVRQGYLEGQCITSSMRAILVDWLVEVHMEFRLLQETLYLTVAVLDRYLQEVKTTKKRFLQLVGVGAMLVASKYEEMYSPDVGDFVYVTDNAYDKREILKMECEIVRTLGFNLGHPLSLHFLRRFSKVAEVKPLLHTACKFILELSLVEYDFCHVEPSRLAAASLCLVLGLFGSAPRDLWTPSLEYYSGYSFNDLSSLVSQLATLVARSPTAKQQAVRKKYSSSKYSKVSSHPQLISEKLMQLAGSA